MNKKVITIILLLIGSVYLIACGFNRKTDDTVIVPSEGIDLAATTARIDRITLYWDTPSIPGYTITGYRIIRSTVQGTSIDSTEYATCTANTFDDIAASTGTTYYYRVVALDDDSILSYSAEVSGVSTTTSTTVDTDYIFVDASYTGGASDGSSANPYTTIAAGVSGVTSDGDGGIILVRDGTYTMTSAITLSSSVEIRSETGRYRYSDVILDGGSSSIRAFLISATGDSSIIRGLEITKFNSGIIQITGGADNVSIIDNYLHDYSGVGISKSDSTATTGTLISGNRIYNQGGTKTTAINLTAISNCTITGNLIDAIPYAGMIVTSLTNSTVSYNTVTNCQHHGINMGPNCGNLVVSYNTFRDLNLSLDQTHGGVRIYCEEMTGPVTIEYNTIENCFNGIYLNAGSAGHIVSLNTITAHYNIVTGNTNRGICNTSDDGAAIEATNNWFGTTTGPYNADSNTSGTGDTVDSSYVTFSPWLTSAP